MAPLPTNDAEPLRPVPFSDLGNEYVQPEWLIKGVLTSGFSLMGGLSGGGKSWITDSWLISLATGKPWLGKFDVPRPMVVWKVDNDTDKGRLVSRLRAMTPKEDRPLMGRNLLVWEKDDIHINDPASFARFAAAVRAERPAFIAMETLSKLATEAFEENDKKSMQKALRPLLELQEECGFALLLTHHYKKDVSGVVVNRFRGSGSLPALADTLYESSAVVVDGETRITFSIPGKRWTSSIGGVVTVIQDKKDGNDQLETARLHLSYVLQPGVDLERAERLHSVYVVVAAADDGRSLAEVDTVLERLYSRPVLKGLLDELVATGKLRMRREKSGRHRWWTAERFPFKESFRHLMDLAAPSSEAVNL